MEEKGNELGKNDRSSSNGGGRRCQFKHSMSATSEDLVALP